MCSKSSSRRWEMTSMEAIPLMEWTPRLFQLAPITDSSVTWISHSHRTPGESASLPSVTMTTTDTPFPRRHLATLVRIEIWGLIWLDSGWLRMERSIFCFQTLSLRTTNILTHPTVHSYLWTSLSRWTLTFRHRTCTVLEREFMSSALKKVHGTCGPMVSQIPMMMVWVEEREGTVCIPSYWSRERTRMIFTVSISGIQMQWLR